MSVGSCLTKLLALRSHNAPIFRNIGSDLRERASRWTYWLWPRPRRPVGNIGRVNTVPSVGGSVARRAAAFRDNDLTSRMWNAGTTRCGSRGLADDPAWTNDVGEPSWPTWDA